MMVAATEYRVRFMHRTENSSEAYYLIFDGRIIPTIDHPTGEKF
jgi:hypothetical protein